MAKYLLQANYVGEGVKGLIKDGGSKRRASAEASIKSVGGTMEAFYYAFGEYDAILIADVPDNIAMSALALTVNASGVVTTRTTVLLTPEEVDQVVKKSVSFRPPGQA